jgi:hypothetical protein
MKWSQAICVSILVDGLYPVTTLDGRKPRFGRGLTATSLEPPQRNLLAPIWEPSPTAVQISLLEPEGGGQGTRIPT